MPPRVAFHFGSRQHGSRGRDLLSAVKKTHVILGIRVDPSIPKGQRTGSSKSEHVGLSQMALGVLAAGQAGRRLPLTLSRAQVAWAYVAWGPPRSSLSRPGPCGSLVEDLPRPGSLCS